MSPHAPSLSRADLCERLLDIGRAAGDAILEVYRQQGEISGPQTSDEPPGPDRQWGGAGRGGWGRGRLRGGAR